MRESIAVALKSFAHIDSDNIVDALRQLELRGIKVDRCTNYDDLLNFVDERKGTASRFRSGEFATSVNEIPNFEKFFSQAARYLRQVKFVIRDEVVAGGKAEPLLIDTSVIEMIGPVVFTLGEKYESPEFRLRISNSTDISIDEFVQNNMPDHSAQIELRGPSEWTLNEVKRRLHEFGFKHIAIRIKRIGPSRWERATHTAHLLKGEMFSVPNFATLLRTVIAGLVGFLLRHFTM